MHQSIDKKNKIILYLIFLIILSTTNGKFSEREKDYSLVINKVDVKGLPTAHNLKILSELSNIFHQSVFTLKKEKINKIVSKHNIIEEYSVKKIYPSKLSVNIKPTKFLARVSDNNELVVGANGKLVITKNYDQTLPYFFGEFNSDQFMIFKKNIEESQFNFNDLKIIYFFPSKRWDILTIDNILIKLPNNNFLRSLNLANKLITHKEFKNNKIIDLRVAKHLIVK